MGRKEGEKNREEGKQGRKEEGGRNWFPETRMRSLSTWPDTEHLQCHKNVCVCVCVCLGDVTLKVARLEELLKREIPNAKEQPTYLSQDT